MEQSNQEKNDTKRAADSVTVTGSIPPPFPQGQNAHEPTGNTFICPGCGSNVKAGQSFCSTCGSPFAWDNDNEKKSRKKSFSGTVAFKVLIICLVAVGLLIPTLLIDSISTERKEKAESSQREIASKWSLPQHVTGPVICIPFTSGNGSYYHYILPKNLNISAGLKAKTLHRGIYESIVYDSEIDMKGTFTIAGLLPDKTDSLKLHLERAKIKVGLTDLRGIADKLSINFGGKDYDINDGGVDDNFQTAPEVRLNNNNNDRSSLWLERLDLNLIGSNMARGDASVAMGKVDLTQYVDSSDIPFSLRMNLKGSELLCFSPVGETTNISVKGDCPDPSFGGNFLPNERNVTSGGFGAKWKVISINRSYPQSFHTKKGDEITNSEIQIGMRVQVDNFRMAARAIKYAFLVIVLTLVAALFAKLRTRRTINAFQYLLIGLALVLFYSLLLSISELMAFEWAYLIATVMTVSMVTLYLIGVLRVKRQALMIGGLLTILYGFIYVLLNLENYALLVGSIGLFIILSLIMYYSLDLTRKNVMPKE